MSWAAALLISSIGYFTTGMELLLSASAANFFRTGARWALSLKIGELQRQIGMLVNVSWTSNWKLHRTVLQIFWANIQELLILESAGKLNHPIALQFTIFAIHFKPAIVSWPKLSRFQLRDMLKILLVLFSTFPFPQCNGVLAFELINSRRLNTPGNRPSSRNCSVSPRLLACCSKKRKLRQK